MHLKYLQKNDRIFAAQLDAHLDEQAFENHVRTNSGYIIWEKEARIGLLHYCMLWDHLPFLNYICILPAFRGRGYGSAALNCWEAEMKKAGCTMVMVSTQVDEQAQRLYRRLGYVDCGGLIFAGTPLEQPMELFMRKILPTSEKSV